jgi:hypothetical protein
LLWSVSFGASATRFSCLYSYVYHTLPERKCQVSMAGRASLLIDHCLLNIV